MSDTSAFSDGVLIAGMVLAAALAGLTTRGRCLVSAGLALCAGAALLGQRDLLRVGLFLLALPLVAVAVVARTRYQLACARGVEPALGRRQGRAADLDDQPARAGDGLPAHSAVPRFARMAASSVSSSSTSSPIRSARRRSLA